MSKTVIIAGFFPPPITGQGLATERLAELLASSTDVVRINLREGEAELDLNTTGRFVQKVSGYRSTSRKLSKALKANPNVTVIWTSPSPELMGHLRDLLTILPSIKSAKRIYGVVHWGRFSKLFSSHLTSLTSKLFLNRVDGLIFLNKDRADDCTRWVPAGKSFVIPNTLDQAVICSEEEVEEKQRTSYKNKPLRLLFLSHMIREKGYLDVLEAIRLLRETEVPVQATFAGQWLSDNDRIFFEKKLAEYQLTDVVIHLGPIQDRKIIKTLHLDSDVFVLPSYMIEGQPLSIIEAMNAGSPIIASNIGGMVDMIDNGSEGFLVAPQKAEAIANAVRQLVNKDVWQSMSKAVRRRYINDYSSETVLNKWLYLIS